MTERLTAPDELTCYYDRPAEPANIHLEARIGARLDEAAIRAAVLAVLKSEPRLLARRAQATWLQRRYSWEVAPAPNIDPVWAVRYADPADLDRQRDSFLSRSPSLDMSPPVLFLLASGPDGDYLILNAHHARFDGLSCLRLARLVAAEYRTRTGSPAGHGQAGPPQAAAAAAAEHAAPVTGATRPAPGGRGASRRAAAITRVAAGPGGVRSLPGYGAHLLTWDGLAATDVLRTATASVNDLLIAALMVTISDWNQIRGLRSGQIRITMPVGETIQASENGTWANCSRLTTVSARVLASAQPADLLAEVARQTWHAKRTATPQVDLASRALVAMPVPVAVKRIMLRIALRAVGPLFCDTSLVSNLGVVDDLAFGAGPAAEVWFSTSAHWPRGLSLGVVTALGKLRLTFRYRRALLSQSDAAYFASRYLKALDQFTGQEAARP
jgi:NRPS condensation-like uncharacterized protein